MDNVVLKSLSVENFFSFADGICFTTENDLGKKEFLENTFEQNDTRFNKVSFMYGSNGSGKTNFCKIMLELKRIIDWSPLSAMNDDKLLTMPGIDRYKAPVTNFAFDKKYSNSPTSFSIEIVIGKVTYNYSFSIKCNEIISESLTKKYRRKETILERSSPLYKDIVLKSELKDFESTKQVVKKDSLCLPIAAMLNNKLAIKIISAIKDIEVVNMTSARINPPEVKKAFSQERIARYVEVIRRADPTIKDINVSFEEKEIGRQKVISDDFENREIISKMTKVGIGTKHAIYDNGIESDFSEKDLLAIASLGTIKLFTVLPYLYSILESGGIIFIDELENGLHLSLAKELIGLFTSEKTNPNHAQLICTSHQPLLLDGDYRRDQVWITEKDAYGKSTLHRLSEKSTPRAKINLTSKILEGAFGCNPDKFFA